MEQLTIKLHQFSINSIPEWLLKNKHSSIVVLTDENTSKFCLPKIEAFLTSDYLHISIPAGENSKTLDSAQIIWNKLLENNIDRNALMINLGGGMITDIGGFCAATYKRGIPFINIPTTLMGMVDASIGGKAGVNMGGYKNQVGVFAMPDEIFIDPAFLKTLPKRELISGFAEVIKYSLIYDLEFSRDLLNIHPLNVEDWMPIIQNCVRIKEEIVSKDPKEQGLRKILNFGHTIGHAIESYSLAHSTKPLLHGEAVAFGMIAELYLSVKRTGLNKDAFEEMSNYLKIIFGSFPWVNVDIDILYRYMLNDKKNSDNSVMFVLLENIGKAVFDINCSFDEINEAINYLKTSKVSKTFEV